VEGRETNPLPDDPTLAAIARALNDAGHWATIVDRNWRNLYMTDAIRLSFGGLLEFTPFPVGSHYYSSESVNARLTGRGHLTTPEGLRHEFEALGPYVLAAAEGGREELRELVDPRLRDIVDRLSPSDLANALSVMLPAQYVAGVPVEAPDTFIPVRDSDGRVMGIVRLTKPAASMAVLGTIAAGGDLRHFERMQQVAKAGRRPAAILFGDLESSSSIARRLSTASYFSLGRRLMRAADQCVIDAGGLVGRHVGDGVAAFFLTENAGSESAAARSCIEAARNIREAMISVAARSELAPEDLRMRFGLHWGATLYVGQISTSGRAEVTALGDESTRARGSRRAPPADEPWPRRSSSSAWTPSTPPPSPWPPTGLPTPPSRTSRPRPRRPAATPRLLPCARCRALATIVTRTHRPSRVVSRACRVRDAHAETS
jgi:class 3 adenylate cyclase